MFLNGFRLPPLNSMQDTLCQAIWMRREQFRLFETMINVLSMGLAIDPKVSERIEGLMNEYIDLVIPGSEERRINKDKVFADRTQKALNDITKLLSGSNNSKVKVKRKGL